MNKTDELFHAYIKDLNPKVVFEFGSYDLYHGIYYRQLWPGADVYCFEPDPNVYKGIKNVAKNFKINLFNCAVANVDEDMMFYPTCVWGSGIGPSGSIYKHSTHHKESQRELQQFRDPIKVQAITISSFCRDRNICGIDFMHIDVEGAVLKVLGGFGSLRPKMLRVEVNGRDALFEGAPSGDQINKVLAQMGYKIKAEKQVDILYEYGN
jgi:FkbM family methyltransferase